VQLEYLPVNIIETSDNFE